MDENETIFFRGGMDESVTAITREEYEVDEDRYPRCMFTRSSREVLDG